MSAFYRVFIKQRKGKEQFAKAYAFAGEEQVAVLKTAGKPLTLRGRCIAVDGGTVIAACVGQADMRRQIFGDGLLVKRPVEDADYTKRRAGQDAAMMIIVACGHAISYFKRGAEGLCFCLEGVTKRTGEDWMRIEADVANVLRQCKIAQCYKTIDASGEALAAALATTKDNCVSHLRDKTDGAALSPDGMSCLIHLPAAGKAALCDVVGPGEIHRTTFLVDEKAISCGIAQCLVALHLNDAETKDDNLHSLITLAGGVSTRELTNLVRGASTAEAVEAAQSKRAAVAIVCVRGLRQQVSPVAFLLDRLARRLEAGGEVNAQGPEFSPSLTGGVALAWLDSALASSPLKTAEMTMECLRDIDAARGAAALFAENVTEPFAIFDAPPDATALKDALVARGVLQEKAKTIVKRTCAEVSSARQLPTQKDCLRSFLQGPSKARVPPPPAAAQKKKPAAKGMEAFLGGPPKKVRRAPAEVIDVDAPLVHRPANVEIDVDAEPWTCSKCTYHHVEAEAGFLACAMCGAQKE